MPIELLLALRRWVVAVLRVGTLCAVALVAVGYAWSAVAGQPGVARVRSSGRSPRVAATA